MILTIDEGTTSTRALIINAEGQILGIAQQEFKQIFPQPGWVEHDAEEIWQKTLAVCRTLIIELSKSGGAAINKKDDDIKITLHESKTAFEPSSLSAIAITNQRETTVIWDRATSKPIHNAIVWQCRRTSGYCDELKKDPAFVKLVREQTGLPLDAYFSGTKIRWILDQHKSIQDLAFGTIDTWLIWQLTKGKSHLTEPSNACRTILYDIRRDTWSEEILATLKIPKSILPKVIHSNGDFGSTDLFADLCGHDLPICSVLGDQQAALYAYKCCDAKNSIASKITYGTGTFVLIEADDYKLVDGLVTSIFYQTDKKKVYAVEGSVFIGGAIVQWLRDGLKIIKESSEIEKLASSVNDNGGVYLVPALAGLGAPFWRQDIRGTIFGITRGTEQGHIARAALESIAFRVRDVLEALGKNNIDSVVNEGHEKNRNAVIGRCAPRLINVDGGVTQSDLLMQFQADLLQTPIQRYSEKEMTALGAAMMSGKMSLKLVGEKTFVALKNLDNSYDVWKSYVRTLLES